MLDSAPDHEQIGQVVRRLRRDRGLTQEDLASRIQRSRSLVQQIENGTRTPPQDVREKLSSVLGEPLPSLGSDDSGQELSDLRMRFNILLGKDPTAVARCLEIAEYLIDFASVPDGLRPFGDIAERQLEQAEDVLAQIPSGTLQVRDWNTVNDWTSVLRYAKHMVRAIHVSHLGNVTGDSGDEYIEELARLAQSEVSVRRLFVIDAVEEIFPHEIGLRQQARAGVETLLINRRFAPNAPGMLVIDDRYLARGEYNFTGTERSASRFSTLKHDIQFATRAFEKLYHLGKSGRFVEVNRILERPELREQQWLNEETRTLFHGALREAWAQADADSPTGDSSW
ncbi:helix-turn-helix transcriptional regulator [Nocardia sp. NPDC048505]|uniref:helix-turn-helix domain-containing protein n=1 Tax=unclassified Nocardia TaxID=2637762 RepID=UPI003403E94F